LLSSKDEVFEETSEEIERIFKLFIKSEPKDLKGPKDESIIKCIASSSKSLLSILHLY